MKRGIYEYENQLKPPIGLIPRKIWLNERFKEVCYAIIRYREAGLEIPQEWYDEYFDLIDDIS